MIYSLRDELHDSALVDPCLAVPPKAYKRDLDAITRLCTGEKFVKYRLEPAKVMRQVIRNQLHVIAPKEYTNPDVPHIQYKS